MTAIVTLTTDFGTTGSYVAEMKGAGLSICPEICFVDVSHQVPPQDVRYAAFLLRQILPHFPPQTIHVAVVDPGVGTQRRILCFRVADQFLIGPDNGVLTWAVRLFPAAEVACRVVTNRSWFRDEVTSTFHGRDIMMPVAARLAAGEAFEEVGPECNDWLELLWPEPTRSGTTIRGEIVFRDPFGNLISNIDSSRLDELGTSGPYEVIVGNGHRARWVRTYGEGTVGELVALVGSSHLVEVAVVQGSAAALLKVGPGTPITIAPAQRGT